MDDNYRIKRREEQRALHEQATSPGAILHDQYKTYRDEQRLQSRHGLAAAHEANRVQEAEEVERLGGASADNDGGQDASGRKPSQFERPRAYLRSL